MSTEEMSKKLEDHKVLRAGVRGSIEPSPQPQRSYPNPYR